jgi:hypothetical protein
MTVFSTFNAIAYAPPGLTHPLLVENYAWVDQLLREKYYGYALTSVNIDEFESSELLTENYDWVDYRLEEMCAPKEPKYCPPALTPITWLDYRCYSDFELLEDINNQFIGIKHKRYESDISDYECEVDRVIKRLRCQSPIPKGKLYINIPHVVSEDETEDNCYSDMVSVDLSDITYDEGCIQVSDPEEDDAESIPYDVEEYSF